LGDLVKDRLKELSEKCDVPIDMLEKTLKTILDEPDHKGFVLHIEEWDKHNVAYSLKDMKELKKRYGIK